MALFFACVAAVAVIGVAAFAGCAQLPERKQPSPTTADALPPNAQALARAVDIVGAKSRLSTTERERVLRGVTANGNAELLQRHLAVDTAQRSVHFTMAYFAPGADMVQALCDAAQRGVQVVLVLPSVSDFSLILEAGRSYYGQLISCGVQVHELKDALLHAKTAVIDGVVSTVGSSNLDWRSFVANDEVNAIVLGEDFGSQMEAMFQRDVQDSQRITLDIWQSRPMTRRVKEWLGRTFERPL